VFAKYYFFNQNGMNKQIKKSQLTWFGKNEEDKKIQEILDEEFDALSF
jgi:hypothetical protein